jgi:hypothetical protein
MTGALERIKPWLYPSLIQTYHDRPLPFLLGNVPTVGQSFYSAVVVILNIVFLAIGYKTAWPNQTNRWYKNRYQELMAYFMWRTGVLEFCNMPVLFLFSSRNNILFVADQLVAFDLHVTPSMDRPALPFTNPLALDPRTSFIPEHRFVRQVANNTIVDLGLCCHGRSCHPRAHQCAHPTPAGLRAVPDHAHCYGRHLCGRLLVPRLYRVRKHLWL